MFIEIFFAVVVGKFLATPDPTIRHDKDASFGAFGIAIRTARVIDKTRFVAFNVAVDHRESSRPEQILAVVVRHFFECCRATNVFDDACAFRNIGFGK